MTFLSLVVGIATIIAGVIGIGNILLISVKERTKELGVRRALGATPGEVRMQIILESVFLTTLPGSSNCDWCLVLAGINWGTTDLQDFHTNPTVPISFICGLIYHGVFRNFNWTYSSSQSCQYKTYRRIKRRIIVYQTIIKPV